MNILKRINWTLIIVWIVLLAGCTAFWYFVISFLYKLFKAMGAA